MSLDPLIGNSSFGHQFTLNTTWTEWSIIYGVISKLDEREARGGFEITTTVRHEVQLLIYRIYNKFWN